MKYFLFICKRNHKERAVWEKKMFDDESIALRILALFELLQSIVS